MPQPRKRDVTMLKEWISREDLGGGIVFSGDDLSPLVKTVYDDAYLNDLMIINNRAGENDSFTKFLSGPVFYLFERLWRYTKVSEFRTSFDNVARSC